MAIVVRQYVLEGPDNATLAMFAGGAPSGSATDTQVLKSVTYDDAVVDTEDLDEIMAECGWAPVVSPAVQGSSEGVSDFSAANNYAAAAATLRGDATGFTVMSLIRLIGSRASAGDIFANYRVFQPDGGWGISITDDDRIFFSIGQQSDGQVVSNFNGAYVSGTGTGNTTWRKYGRLFLAAMVYDGSEAFLHVNAEEFGSLTPGSGYEIADAALTPFIGRNNSGGLPMPVEGLEVIGCGYVESAIAQSELIDHQLACMEAGRFVDLPTTSFDSYWNFDGETSAPAALIDQGGGGVNFTLAGALDLTLRKSIW